MFTKKQKNCCESKVFAYGILGAAAEIGYIFLVAMGMMVLQSVMPHDPPMPFGMVIFLLLFVFSVAISGLLVLGYPVYLALQGKVADAFTTVGVSVATFFVFGLFMLLLLPLLV